MQKINERVNETILTVVLHPFEPSEKMGTGIEKATVFDRSHTSIVNTPKDVNMTNELLLIL
jgi:hypothetical protein